VVVMMNTIFATPQTDKSDSDYNSNLQGYLARHLWHVRNWGKSQVICRLKQKKYQPLCSLRRFTRTVL